MPVTTRVNKRVGKTMGEEGTGTKRNDVREKEHASGKASKRDGWGNNTSG